MMIELESMAVEMPEVAGHPNRAAFRGVLTVVDVASTRAPAGSKGRRVILTRSAAETALPSLIGMGLDYAPSFDGHDQRRKVGVITSADIVSRNVEVGGYLYAKDFPEIVSEIRAWGERPAQRMKIPTPSTTSRQALAANGAAKCPPSVKSPPLVTSARSGAPGPGLRSALAESVASLRELTAGMRRRADEIGPVVLRAEAAGGGAGPLGMSYEVTAVEVADNRAHVWILTRVMFTGAAVLRRSRAAYEDTWIELSC